MPKLLYIYLTMTEDITGYVPSPGIEMRDITHEILFMPSKKLAIDITSFAHPQVEYSGYMNAPVKLLAKKYRRTLEKFISGESKTVPEVLEEYEKRKKPVSVPLPCCMSFDYLSYDNPKYNEVITAMFQVKQAHNAWWNKKRKALFAEGNLERACRKAGLLAPVD
jgi:hypothetical protein